MHTYDRYWVTNLARGIAAILASAGIAYLPRMLDSTFTRLLFLPFAIAISLICLSLYGIIDSSLLTTMGCVIRKHRIVHWLVVIEGLIAIAIMILVTVYSADGLNLRFFTYFAALQAFSSAMAEAILSIRARHHQGTLWLLTCASLSLVCGIALLLSGDLSAGDQARLILGYLTLRGVSLILLSLKMLYNEDSPSHRHGLWSAVTGGLRSKGQATA